MVLGMEKIPFKSLSGALAMNRTTRSFARQRTLCQHGLVYRNRMALVCVVLSLSPGIACHTRHRRSKEQYFRGSTIAAHAMPQLAFHHVETSRNLQTWKQFLQRHQLWRISLLTSRRPVRKNGRGFPLPLLGLLQYQSSTDVLMCRLST